MSDQILSKIGAMVLDDWAMLFSEPASERADGTEILTASLIFESDTPGLPAGGTIRVVTSRSFAVLLTRSLLGLDESEEVAETDGEDSLRELANMVAGHFVSEFYGVDASVPLKAPTLQHGDVPPSEVTEVAHFSCDGEPVTIEVVLR